MQNKKIVERIFYILIFSGDIKPGKSSFLSSIASCPPSIIASRLPNGKISWLACFIVIK